MSIFLSSVGLILLCFFSLSQAKIKKRKADDLKGMVAYIWLLISEIILSHSNLKIMLKIEMTHSSFIVTRSLKNQSYRTNLSG